MIIFNKLIRFFASKCTQVYRRVRFLVLSRLSGAYTGKIICVGRNKTGTTSMQTFFTNVGYSVAPQHEGEHLIFKADFKPDEQFWTWMDKYEVFQDVPFSHTWFLPELVKRYPAAKFILTVRDEQDWYASLTNHIFKHLGVSDDTDGEDIVNAIKNDTYIAKGYMEALYKKTYGQCEPNTVYDKTKHIHAYNQHNKSVRNMIDKSNLLELNVSEQGDAKQICEFLKLPSTICFEIPWENKRR